MKPSILHDSLGIVGPPVTGSHYWQVIQKLGKNPWSTGQSKGQACKLMHLSSPSEMKALSMTLANAY